MWMIAELDEYGEIFKIHDHVIFNSAAKACMCLDTIRSENSKLRKLVVVEVKIVAY